MGAEKGWNAAKTFTRLDKHSTAHTLRQKEADELKSGGTEMKRILAFGLCFTLICCLLAGCSQPLTSSSDVSAVSSGSEPASVSSQAVPDVTFSPTFKQVDFEDFFVRLGYANYITFLVDGPAVIQDKANSTLVCALMTNYLYDFDTRNGTLITYDPVPGTFLFPLDRLSVLSQEMFGAEYDFSHALTLSSSKQPGYLSQMWADTWPTQVLVNPKDMSYENGVATCYADYWQIPQDGSFPTPMERRTFQFSYNPEASLCPYTLLSVASDGPLTQSATAGGVSVPVAAGVTAPDTLFVRPPYSDVYAAGGLNLRKGPSENNDVITLMAENSAVRVLGHLESAPGWMYVEYGNQQGWASAQYMYGIRTEMYYY